MNETLTERGADVLPLPNNSFNGAVVVASCWLNDEPEEGPLSFVLLLLDPEPDYYRVAVVRHGVIVWALRFANIIPAAQCYEEQIGGY